MVFSLFHPPLFHPPHQRQNWSYQLWPASYPIWLSLVIMGRFLKQPLFSFSIIIREKLSSSIIEKFGCANGSKYLMNRYLLKILGDFYYQKQKKQLRKNERRKDKKKTEQRMVEVCIWGKNARKSLICYVVYGTLPATLRRK